LDVVFSRFALSGGTAWSQGKMAGGGTEKAVALEQQWLQSQKANNPDLVALLAVGSLQESSRQSCVLRPSD
jgi:hypothetical protein